MNMEWYEIDTLVREGKFDFGEMCRRYDAPKAKFHRLLMG